MTRLLSLLNEDQFQSLVFIFIPVCIQMEQQRNYACLIL